VNSFYGIRYAQPPTEQLRWRPPQPIEKALDHSEPSILNATTRGPSCVQGQAFWQNPSMLPFKPDGAEDCLLLDVVQPAGIEQTANLPVIVQIHGGCYIHLDSQSFTGYALMKHSQNSIIYISIQYRLGAYGFLYSDELGQEGSANLGLQDQRYALQWIKRHISAFGGDPGKVTIMGGSAGGASVTNQMILYGGAEAPLFRAAIAEYPWWPPYLAKKQLLKQYKKLLTAANCTDMSCLRSLDEDSLALAAQTTFITGYGDYGYGNCYYGPYVDGLVVQDYPSKEFEKGNYVKVPVILDRERFEGYTFTNTSMTTIEEETEDLKIQFPGADEGFVEEVLSLYPREDFNSTFFQRQTWFGDIYIDCPTYYVASSMSSAGLPVWKMLFETGSQKHGATVPYLFDVNYGCKSPEPPFNVQFFDLIPVHQSLPLRQRRLRLHNERLDSVFCCHSESKFAVLEWVGQTILACV
ncbi:alpha/beta-hydrolase, partial [Delitschia confertaspora ATCC 74209]